MMKGSEDQETDSMEPRIAEKDVNSSKLGVQPIQVPKPNRYICFSENSTCSRHRQWRRLGELQSLLELQIFSNIQSR